MTKLMKLAAVALVAAAVVSSPSLAATKKKPAPKKAPTQPSTTNKATLGTTQLKGSEPKFGETWTLGKTNPWNVTLKSAEYSVDQFQYGDQTQWPKADEKFLILHYTIHNPQPRECLMRSDTFRFTVVDPSDNDWQGKSWVVEEQTGVAMGHRLKPAQKMQVCTAIPVPASGVMPKLMWEGSDKLVLRYDLREGVKGLPAPFADPNDKTGATALENVPAQPGVYYPMGWWDVKLDGAALVTEEIKNAKPPKGSQWIAVTLTAKNISHRNQLLRGDSFVLELRDQDSITLRRHYYMYFGSRWSNEGPRIDPGQEMVFRCLFPVEADQKLKSFTMRFSPQDRAFTFDASGWK